MKSASLSKTKIVCTIGPASQSLEKLKMLIRAGMDVARLNFSHGTRADHSKTLENLRIATTMMEEPITILQDLSGPKIRVRELATPSIELKPKTLLRITTENVLGTSDRISTTYANLPADVNRGDRILLDDGKLRLEVESVEGQDVVCRVIVGGLLLPRKGMNLPGVKISVPSLTEKDKEDLLFGLDQDVDYVALSFVRSAADVVALREFIVEHGRKGKRVPIISKIEKPEAIANFDAILSESDAIMVARGDLGVEMPTEEVPMLQKMIVRKCNEAGKPVIIATQMLESMIESPTPTRAEASDVANAVYDGADAVMLSAETSIGRYPIEAASVMDRILTTTEENLSDEQYELWRRRVQHAGTYDALSHSACLLANDLRASAIVALTHSGATAASVAKFRPRTKIIAVTDRDKIKRRLNLIWGVRSVMVEDLKKDTDEAFRMIREKLLAEGDARRGDLIVTLAGLPLFEGRPTNTIKVDRVE